MAINKVMLAALKALSYPEIDLEKTYKWERSIQNILHPPIKRVQRVVDYEMELADHKVPLRIFYPDTPAGGEVLLFLHGGGFVTGNLESYTATCSGLCQSAGRRVVSVDYKLAPEYRFPYAVEECYQVALKMFADSSFLGEEAAEIVIIGDSAGGNLSAVLSLMARDRGQFQFGKQILIYPSTYNDHSEASPFPSIWENGRDYLLTSKKLCDYLKLYISSEADWNNPYFAPMLAGDFSRQPDTLIITAQYDPLRDEGEAYGEQLKRAGNRVEIYRIPDAIHGFFSLPVKFQQVKQSHSIIREFLEKEA